MKIFAGIVSLLLIAGCVEPYEPETDVFESVLVVDATITDELKKQEIVISETYPLEERRDTVNFVNDADVTVFSNSGETYNFIPTGNGRYESVIPFQASMGNTYRLQVTANNELYESSEESISGTSELDSLYVQRSIGNNGLPGAAILVNNASDNRNFYRYTYTETYKIVSPYVRDEDLILNEEGEFEVVPKTQEEETCYNTLNSSDLIVANTENVVNNSYSGFLVKFMNFRNVKLFHRYSILVSQLNISREAYNYFQTSIELAGNENVFSQKQPGFLQGNLKSVENEDRKVIGYFSVASVDKKRIFFNYTDIFSLEERPSLIRNCTLSRPPAELLAEFLEFNQVKFLERRVTAPPDQYGGGPYLVVNTFCMDCTVYGTNIAPDFWTE